MCGDGMKKIIIIALFIFAASGLIYAKTYMKGEVIISFTGDILLDRGVGEKILQEGNEYPYEYVKDILNRSDIVYGNLECPLLNEGTPTIKRRELIFKGEVANSIALKEAGYNILNLANNHAMDYGVGGLLSTINVLKASSIKSLGGGTDKNSSHNPVVISKNGVKVGFLGYSMFPPEGYVYLEDKPDIARFSNSLTSEDIKKARSQCDFLIVTFHWGKEFSYFPSDLQRESAHLAIDSGCDMVVGHHPHVLQGIENYKEKPIYYSLGNFVFDKQIPPGTDESIILNIRVNKNGIVDSKIVPVRIKSCQPVPLYGEDAEYILNRIRLYSEGI
jgi:poly-gamma-glutamate synthesis protein (capsule biosynthesis protein)